LSADSGSEPREAQAHTLGLQRIAPPSPEPGSGEANNKPATFRTEWTRAAEAPQIKGMPRAIIFHFVIFLDQTGART
jgi:hypothetical protein